MIVKKLDIWLTPTAYIKLKEIYAYSYKEWGRSVAIKYMMLLETTIKEVASGKRHTKINRNFSTRFSYLTCKRHHIFFEYKDDKLIVATIFHTAMNVKERMTEEIIVLRKDIDNV